MPTSECPSCGSTAPGVIGITLAENEQGYVDCPDPFHKPALDAEATALAADTEPDPEEEER
jgi:hypothetical protein